MEDSQIKTILEDQRMEYQRYIGVVVEGLQGSVKLIVDSLGDLQKQTTDLREMAAKNTGDIHIIKKVFHLDPQSITTASFFLEAVS